MKHDNILKNHRARIDMLDDRITELLAERASIVREVADLKEAHGIPAVLPDRIEQVISRNAQAADIKEAEAGDHVETYVKAIYADIVRHSCALETALMKDGKANAQKAESDHE